MGKTMTRKVLEKRLREIPLIERIQKAKTMVGKMCSERRPPQMTIPVYWADEDFWICRTLEDAEEAIRIPLPEAEAMAEAGEAMATWLSDLVRSDLGDEGVADSEEIQAWITAYAEFRAAFPKAEEKREPLFFCETCSDPIFEGDEYYQWTDVATCKECGGDGEILGLTTA